MDCINNVCQKHECALNEDCNDDNSCTIDKCTTSQLKVCSYDLIKSCINNDTCCPTSCGTADDTDCEIQPQKIEPTTNESAAKTETTTGSLQNETVKKETQNEEPNKTELESKLAEKPAVNPVEQPKSGGKGLYIIGGIFLIIIIVGIVILTKK
ncbi:hypothetical protein FJZ53_05005 [Candidatus Woesearchaeota archaeon]|nr:hypothetical protein [Candidatus Woesearchaeota archaeon]